MIVVLASRFDAQAAWLAERWRSRGACLLTCEDLSRRGWRHESGAPERSFAVLDGNTVPVESIRGVLTRLFSVTELELPHIAPDERAYVAAEMTAFLLAWLYSLRCRVLNRPTPSSLCGPNWSSEQWLSEAARAGLRVEPCRRSSARFDATRSKARTVDGAREEDAAEAESAISFVGPRYWADRASAELDADTLAGVQRLADSAKVELLTTTFAGEPSARRLVSVMPWVEPTRPEIADALLERLEGAP